MIKTLRQKNTRDLFLRLLIVMIAGSAIFYVVLRMHANHMQRKQLELSQLNVWKAFKKQQGNISLNINEEYEITNKDFVDSDFLNEPRDTTLYYPGTNDKYPFKIMTREYFWNGVKYQLTTYVSSTEINHLIIKVFMSEALILALLFISAIYINRKTSFVLWMPFRFTLKKLNEYDVTISQPINLPQQTGIAEFNELNLSVSNLFARVNQAYNNQKQFVENASHEIQTPLAIIRSKIELLIDQPGMNEEIASLLSDITEANERLSQMNKNLLLLSKIENNQFPAKSNIRISFLIDEVLFIYQHHYEDRFPEVIKSVQQNPTVIANPSLMEILIQNLIRNAVVHNISQGYIKIDLDHHSLKISNAGTALTIDPRTLFERFKKGSDEIKSTGLGLSLAKQICQLYGFIIDYTYGEGIHTITVIFN